MSDPQPEYRITPSLLLRAYSAGVFPMAQSADADDIFWVDPERRGILPLDGFHIPRSLRKRIRQGGFEVRVNRDFDGVLAGCAARGPSSAHAGSRLSSAARGGWACGQSG